jgi:hypothetical protein
MPSEPGRLARSLATLDGIARVAQTEVDATAPMNRVVSGLTVAGKMITAVPSPARVAARSTCVAYSPGRVETETYRGVYSPGFR